MLAGNLYGQSLSTKPILIQILHMEMVVSSGVEDMWKSNHARGRG
jgi:hypothetical protein